MLKNNFVDPFNASQKACRVSVEFRGANLDKQLRVAMLSGNGPDIVLTAGPAYVAPMAQAGQLLALDSYAAKYNWTGSMLPAIYDTGKIGGKLYALPKTYESMALFYNKSLFDKYSWKPPTTLKELETVASAMVAKGIVPFSQGNADWKGANEWLVTTVFNQYAGPDNLAKALQGKLPWTAPVFVESIDLLKSWWDKGYFGKNYFSLTTEQAYDQLAAGKAGMSINGTWAFQWQKAFADSGMVRRPRRFPRCGPGCPRRCMPWASAPTSRSARAARIRTARRRP